MYERQNQISASTAESRASKILHGLGFSIDMQRRATQSFRCADVRSGGHMWMCGGEGAPCRRPLTMAVNATFYWRCGSTEKGSVTVGPDAMCECDI